MSPSTKASLSWSKFCQVNFINLALAAIPWLAMLFMTMRFGCPQESSETCNIDGVIIVLITAIGCLVHATIVALYAWTPLSSGLRKPVPENRSSAFNLVLYGSITADLTAYFVIVAFCIEMKDLVTILQVLTISFNFPFLLAIPYLLAAYRDPSTDIGAFLHRVKARIQASSCCQYNARQHDQYDYSSLPDRSSSSPSDEDTLYERLENALLILPRPRPSPQHQHQYSRSQSQSQTQVGRDVEEGKLFEETEKEKMKPFPRFTLFVTAPNDNSNRSQPEP